MPLASLLRAAILAAKMGWVRLLRAACRSLNHAWMHMARRSAVDAEIPNSSASAALTVASSAPWVNWA